MPVRVLRNKMTEQIEKMGEAEADEFLKTSGDASYVQEGGNRETATMPCGQSVGVVKEVGSVSQVFMEMIRGAEAISERLGVFFAGGE